MIIKPTEKQVEIYARGNAIPFSLGAWRFRDHENNSREVSIDIEPFYSLGADKEIGYIWTKGGFSRNLLKGEVKVVLAPRDIEEQRLPYHSLYSYPPDKMDPALYLNAVDKMMIFESERHLRTLSVTACANTSRAVGRGLMLKLGLDTG